MEREHEHQRRDSDAEAWASVCERFEAIMLGAARHKLDATFTALTRMPPDTPGLLAHWRALDVQISRLDRQEWNREVRHHEPGRALETRASHRHDEDEWGPPAPLDAEYRCPEKRCTRRERATSGRPPYCGLLSTEMVTQPEAD